MTCDLEVDVNGEEIFLVDKDVLSSFCGKLRKVIGKSSITSATKSLKITLHDLPGGAEAFELVTKFCYNKGRTQISPSNTCLLHSIAHFMEMADYVSSSTNLLKLTEKSLEGIPYWSWPELVSALKQCQGLFPAPSSSGMLDKLVDSLVGRITAASDVASPTGSSPESSAFRFSCDTGSTISAKNSSRRAWWFEDFVVLNPDMIQKIIKSMVVQKLSHVLISRFLMYYLKSVASNASPDKKKAAETVTDLLYSLDGSSVSCKGLFGVLRIASSLKLSKSCQNKLESMIGKQFDQTTLDNLLVPAPSGMDSLYDVNLVLRFLKSFASCGDRESIARLKQAGSILDSYLAEVAPDCSLKPLKFLALATVLPDEARDSHDLLYRAIDMYLEVHTQLSDEEKTKICCAMNYEKLSSESCKHLARNARFPSRTAIRALISQQLKLRSLLQETNQFEKCDHAPSRGNNQCNVNQSHEDEQIVLYAKKLDLSIENEKLKSQLQGMQQKVMELEKICRKMQRQMAKAMKTTRVSVPSSGSRSLPRLCS